MPAIAPTTPAPPRVTAFILITSWLAKLVLLVWPLGEIVSIAFKASSQSLTPFAAWLGLLAFAMQVYLVASSAFDLVVGSAHLRGKGPMSGHFEATYRSGSLTEFWQRVLRSFNTADSAVWIAPLIVLPFAALFMGLSFSQIAWLAVMELLLWLELKRCGGRALWQRMPKFLRSIMTFAVLLVGWVLLRSANLDHALHYYGALWGQWTLTETALLLESRITSDSNLLLVIASVIIVIVLPPVHSLIEPVKKWKQALAGVAALLVVGSAFPVWSGMTYRLIKRGNQSVMVGREGWLFDARELNALTGDGALQPERSAWSKSTSKAPAAIIGFAHQLKERGVPLLVIPLPMKASLYPEYITGSDPDESEAPLYHADQPTLYDQLTKAGIDVQDVTQAMLQLKERKTPVFHKQDSHWTPEAMQVLAKHLAAYIRKKYPGIAADNPMIVDAKAPSGFGFGDLAQKARLDGLGTPLVEEEAVMVSFPSIENDPDSPLALLGGSDVRIYDDPALGFSDDGGALKAGFAQHLALYLGKRIDCYTQPHPHQALAQRLDDDVRAKKLVIWVIPARDLLQPPSAGQAWPEVKFNPARRPPEVLTPMVPGAAR